MTDNRNPFLLRPSGKDYLWGGRRLNDEFDKGIDMDPLAETWECSTHPAGASYAVTGEHSGRELAQILRAHPEYLGTHCPDGLPILIKFIDADKDLSVQVHPDDAYAAEHEAGQRGKTEMWYILDAAKDAKIYYGFNRPTDKNKLRKAIGEGKLEKYLRKVPARKDDVFFIHAGCVHAIGAGVLLAEIQENSDLTYRMYDYDRVDKNGNKRPLHVEKALEVADTLSPESPRQPLRVLKYTPGVASELLGRCKYFEVYRMIVDTQRRQIVRYCSDELSFRVLLCVNGCGTISYENETLNICKGDCIFFPASSPEVTIHGQMVFLDVRG